MNKHGCYACYIAIVVSICLLFSPVYALSKTHISSKKKPVSDNGYKDKLKKKKSINRNHSLMYTIQKGDTLLSIANRYNTSVGNLCSINDITESHNIKVNDTIKINVDSGKGKEPDKKIDSDNQIKPKFIWPVKNILEFHQDGSHGVKPIGIIIKGPKESSVFSAANGTVEKIGRMRGFGQYVVIKHSNRFMTVYSNVYDIRVSLGEEIRAGEVIGKMQRKNPSVHFQIDYAGKPENPLKYLPKKT